MQIESEYLELAIPNLFPHNILIVLTTKPYCSSKPNICSMRQRVLDLRRLVAYNHINVSPFFFVQQASTNDNRITPGLYTSFFASNPQAASVLREKY